MAFFQQSVVNKHLKAQDGNTVKTAHEKYSTYFHNAEIQKNIRESKEEQFQEGFLRELFVNVLGYVLNPHPNFNLTTELKNEKGAKKADGAILQDGKALGVIELKGTDTKDLEKINNQAFSYKNNQTGCVYVITSNFEKLRFFIHNSVDYLEFNLFTLNQQEFTLLYLCLNAQNLLSGIPLKIKEESLLEEEKVTKHLYKDYATFRNDLWQNMVKNNSEKDKLLLFKKTQKLLDRFLFVFFAEDSGLLPPNSISRILKRWTTLQEEDAYKPLYEIFQQYFGYINTGRKGQQSIDDIFAYNGGLFLPDEVLDNINIDDELLNSHVLKLTNYDFQSEVDVNILGHIFENSLNEIENITAEIEGQEIDKSKTKRKKDGVFYTPKYITKYIVDNTVGKLCSEKKQELGIVDEEYAKGRKNRNKEIVKTLDENLQNYRNWLLNLTICDPACGSGAFLNQALEFLIKEHAYIDELESQLLGYAFEFPGVENHILEKNIFGVDINDESVEIAKLSLWLRTAQRGRKLTTLNKNIKCGNSLIDDPAVAGEKAFNWQQEFPQVFEKGGFDVVIGNPPYFNMTKNNTNNSHLDFYILNYISIKNANSKNLFVLFNELGSIILKEKGILSFIIPEGFLKTRSYDDCVMTMNNIGTLTRAIYFEDWVFEDATTGSLIFEYVKKKMDNSTVDTYLMKKNKQIIKLENVNNLVVEKYESLHFPFLKEICDTFKGMVVQDRSNFIHESRNDLPNKFLLGNCMDRYQIKKEFYCDYSALTIIGGTKRIEKHSIVPRVLIRRTGDFLCCTLLSEPALTESTLYSCSPKNSLELNPKFLLAVLNSKLLTYIVRQKMITNEQAFPQILMTDIESLKFPVIEFKEQELFSRNIDSLISEYLELNKLQNQFKTLLQSKFEIPKLTTKLENWHELDFKDFLKELSKAKVNLSLPQEAEWMNYFNEQKQKAQQLKSDIAKTDREIDQMVYQLYELTEEEIKIVEGTSK